MRWASTYCFRWSASSPTSPSISRACATSFLREAAPPEGRASAVGLYVMFYYVGGTVAGVVPSYVWKWGEWPACVVFIALVDVASIVIALRAWRMPAGAA